MALEVISAYSNNQAANTRMTMFADDSNVIRNFPQGKKCYLLSAYGISESNHAEQIASIRSPRMHDNVQGIQFPFDVNIINFFGPMQELVAQDNLNLFTNYIVGAAEYDNLHLLVYYEDIPAAQGNYATWDSIRDKLGQVMTLKHSITPTLNTDYSGGEVITTDQDEFDALKNYAFLGFGYSNPECMNAVFLRGHDTGNLRIGIPGMSSGNPYSDFPYIAMAKKTGLPVIPIINAANKDNTYVDVAASDSLAAVSFYSYWAQIKD